MAASWSDEEVARRWWRLHPGRRNEDGSPAEPEPHEIACLQVDADALAQRRWRLSSVSWWMRSLCEPVARRANREDAWLDTVSYFGRWFHRAVGRMSSMAACAGRSGKLWFHGRRFSRRAFG